MSHETRTVRPYVGARELERALDEALLHFGPAPCAANENIHVDLQAHEFLLRPISIDWASDDAAFTRVKRTIELGARKGSYDLDDLAIAVVATSSFLKLAEVVYIRALGDLDVLPRKLVLTDACRPKPFSAPFSGFGVEAYIMLAREIERRPLRPYRKGTWLSRVRFGVDTTLTAAILPPTPLTAERRKELRLPARTMRFIDFGNHEVLEAYGDQEQPTFYVDENLLAQLNARRTSATSRAFQRQLVFDFISAVVWKAARSSEIGNVAYADVRTSLLGSVVRIAAGVGASDADRNGIMGSVRDAPERLIARAEHAVDVLSVFGEAAKDGES